MYWWKYRLSFIIFSWSREARYCFLNYLSFSKVWEFFSIFFIFPLLIEYPYLFSLWGIEGHVLARSINFFYFTWILRLALFWSFFSSCVFNKLNIEKETCRKLVQEHSWLLSKIYSLKTWTYTFAISFSKLLIKSDSLSPEYRIFCDQNKTVSYMNLYDVITTNGRAGLMMFIDSKSVCLSKKRYIVLLFARWGGVNLMEPCLNFSIIEISQLWWVWLC